MSLPAVNRITPAEYLAVERLAETKHELIDGAVYAMSGTSRWHVRIVANLVRELGNILRDRDCDAVSSDLRIRIPITETYVYPDVAVFCGGGSWLDGTLDTLQDPVLIAEVLSPSTERYDRGIKFQRYQAIEALKAYVLVSQDRLLVEVYHRQPDHSWRYVAYTHLDNVLDLPSLEVSLPLGEIYYRVAFEDVVSEEEG